MRGNKVVIPVELETKSFDKQIAEVEYDLELLEKAYATDFEASGGEMTEDLRNQEIQIEKLKNKLIDLRKQQLKLNGATKEYGNSFGNTFKKIGKMGLAIFGIRSAYSLILRSANQLANENDEIAGKMSVIGNSLTNLIAPIAETLVNLVFKLLSYLNVITKKFLNVDLFKKTAKSGKKAVGSAQKLRKTIAAFDEMNILNDNTGGGGGGGADTKEPTPVDTGDFEKTVDEYKAMWDELLEIDRMEAAKLFTQSDSTWGFLKFGWFDTIQGIAKIVTGFIDIFKGIWEIIVGIANGNTEKIKEGVVTLIHGIGNILVGLVQTVLGVGEMILGAIWGLIKTIIDGIYQKLIIPVGKFFKDMWDGFLTKGKTAWSGIKTVFSTVATFFKNIFTKAWNGVKSLFSKGGKIFDGMKEGIVAAFKAIVNAIISGINKAIAAPFKAINKLLNKIHDVDILGVKPFKSFWSKDPLSIPKIPKLAKGGIINMPGKGVPIGGGIAKAGEVAPEGVIPLNDSQQMALLGEAIGKYININATIPVYVGTRQVSREMRKIEAEDDFAYNR